MSFKSSSISDRDCPGSNLSTKDCTSAMHPSSMDRSFSIISSRFGFFSQVAFLWHLYKACALSTEFWKRGITWRQEKCQLQFSPINTTISKTMAVLKMHSNWHIGISSVKCQAITFAGSGSGIGLRVRWEIRTFGVNTNGLYTEMLGSGVAVNQWQLGFPLPGGERTEI